MGHFADVYFLIQVELVELYLKWVVENYGLFSADFYYLKNVMFHNDLTKLEFHLDPVEYSTVNLISIVICERNVHWYVNNTIALVIVKHVIQSTQICSTCQKFKM